MYNAFISYSHAADGKLAPALQTALEKFAKPWYKLRNLNIFRDEASLSASPHLWDNIVKALDKSEYLIYMASPESSESKWVIKEIEYWLEHKSADTLLIALTDGEIVWDNKQNTTLKSDINSLPQILKDKFNAEPFYIDLRTSKTQEDVSLKNPIFKKEVLKIAAHLHGKAPKDLASDEVLVHRKMIRMRNSVIGFLALLLVLSIYQTIEANGQAKLAKKNETEALHQQGLAEAASKLAKMKVIEAEVAKDSSDVNAWEAYLQTNEALRQQKIAVKEKNKAQANSLMSEANRIVEVDATLALRLAEEALIMQPKDSVFKGNLITMYYSDKLFYDIILQVDEVLTVAYSPKGKTILVGSSDGTVYLLDLKGNQLNTFTVGSSGVSSVAFSKEGDTVLTGSSNGIIHLWNLEGNLLKTFKGDDSEVLSVAFSPKGNSILTGSKDGKAYLWGLQGKLEQRFIGHVVAFSPKGNSILTGSNDGKAYLWDLQGKKIEEFISSNNRFDEVSSVAFSKGGDSVLVGGSAGVFMWNRKIKETFKKGSVVQKKEHAIATFKGHKAAIRSAVFSSSGDTILTSSNDGTARLWDLKGTPLMTLKGHQQVVNVATFSPINGKIVLTSSNDGTVRLWDLVGKELLAFKGHSKQINTVAFSSKGDTIITGSHDGTALSWNLDGKPLQILKNASVVYAVDLSPDGKTVLIGSYSGVHLQNLEGIRQKEFKPKYYHNVFSVAFSKSGDRILIGSKKEAYLLNLEGKQLAVFKGHTEEVSAVAFSPKNEDLILTGSWDNTARLWSDDGKLLKTFVGHTRNVRSVAFSPDGQTILTGSLDGTARSWNLDGKRLETFVGHEEAVNAVTFSPKGKVILTGSEDGSIGLWNLNGGRLYFFNANQEGMKSVEGIKSVDFSPDGKTIITSSKDGWIRLWETYPNLLEQLKNKRIKTLSEKQKRKYGIE